jgi:hypothetical protein|tara:strand:+ start:1247 stop:2008 length:762 start_codon:yes stop_codon:yes gene_type:complete
MKTLRRPMFRKGGEVGGGIMTGVMRENYENGTTAERLMKIAGQPAGFDPLTQFLIQGGLSLASQPATGGGAIADIATAVQKPAADLMTGLGERDKMRQQLALKGELIDIEQEGAERIKMLELQGKKQQAEKEASIMLGPDATPEQIQKKAAEILNQRIFGVEERFREGKKAQAISDIYDKYGLTAGPAESFYKFQTTIAPELTQRLNKQFMGPIKKDSKGKYKTRNKQAGIYYDPFAQQAVLLEATGEIQLID